MLHIKIICLGTIKEKFLRENIEEYKKRLTKFCKLEIVELPETRIFNENSKADISKALEKETALIMAAMGKKSYNIPLCIEGKEVSSEKFSDLIESVANNGISQINFIIGSSYGLSDEIKNKGDFKLSVSKMTFPHQMFRAMLLEQVYRAFTIQNNIKYHK